MFVAITLDFLTRSTYTLPMLRGLEGPVMGRGCHGI
jgi:hypothetical protein